MSTIARGNAAEAAVLLRFALARFPVFVPFGGGSPIDVAALLPDDQMILIQVKSARVRGGCVQFNTCNTDHGSGRQHYRGKVDYLAAYAAELDRVYMVPVDACPDYTAHLRLEPTRNNQRIGIRMAEDYTFERWLESVVQASSLAA